MGNSGDKRKKGLCSPEFRIQGDKYSTNASFTDSKYRILMAVTDGKEKQEEALDMCIMGTFSRTQAGDPGAPFLKPSL